MAQDRINPNDQEKEDKFLCDNCHSAFTNKKSLIKHLESSETCCPNFSPPNMPKNEETDEKINKQPNISDINTSNFESKEDMTISSSKMSTENQSTFENKNPSTNYSKSKKEFFKSFSNGKNGDDTKKDLTGRMKCPFCNGRFSEQSTLNKHLRQAHDKNSTKNRSEKACFQNKKSILNRPLKGVDQRKLEENIQVKCSYCKSLFRALKDLVNHCDSIHEGKMSIKPFTCNLCKKSYDFKDGVQRHFSKVHEGNSPYKCNMCDLRFSIKRNLKAHLIKKGLIIQDLEYKKKLIIPKMQKYRIYTKIICLNSFMFQLH